MKWAALVFTLMSTALATGLNAQQNALKWVEQGPGPSLNGNVENIPGNEAVGAIHDVAPHPENPNIIYVGTVNGGIWRTQNATETSPNWTQLPTEISTLSVGAIEFDPTDKGHKTLLAGVGRYSSYFRDGAERIGLFYTKDGGDSWRKIDGNGVLRGLNISGVAARGQTLIVTADAADTVANRGLWRSIDEGKTWTQISGKPESGLPRGPSFDLISDPRKPARLYTNAGNTGIYRSDNNGETWKKISVKAMDDLTVPATNNIELAHGNNNNVYAAIVNSGRLAGLFRSGDGGDTWVALDLPQTQVEGGPLLGIHTGGQGQIHLSITAHPSNHNLVFIGGDRQPDGTEETGNPNAAQFPNSLGARGYSGRLFMVDASKPKGEQAAPITHRNTKSSSSPHADSRDMAFAADGSLLEVDDGGIYKRTNPAASDGDWFSINGNIRTAEFHSVSWDAVSNLVIGGTQDNGTPFQVTPDNSRWRIFMGGDGGVVGIDDTGTPGRSVRYTSFQFLSAFRRSVFDASNNFVSSVFPNLTILTTGQRLNTNRQTQFYTPVALNNVDPNRLIFGGRDAVYESLDQGETLTPIAAAVVINQNGDPIAYGAAGNTDILYVGSRNQVYIRTGPAPAALVASEAYKGGRVASISIDRDSPAIAVVVDRSKVYLTQDTGATWTDITGNLNDQNPGRLRAVAYMNRTKGDAIAIGSNNGIFWAQWSSMTDWSAMGNGFPRARVQDLEYDVADDVLLAGTLGRGAWSVNLGESPTPIAASPDPSQDKAVTKAPDPSDLQMPSKKTDAPTTAPQQPKPTTSDAAQTKPPATQPASKPKQTETPGKAQPDDPLNEMIME